MNKIFKANWTHFPAIHIDAPVDVSKLTEDEQADFIVKKLSTPPYEIDAEILKGTYK
jgi:hypothetical protein